MPVVALLVLHLLSLSIWKYSEFVFVGEAEAAKIQAGQLLSAVGS